MSLEQLIQKYCLPIGLVLERLGVARPDVSGCQCRERRSPPNAIQCPVSGHLPREHFSCDGAGAIRLARPSARRQGFLRVWLQSLGSHTGGLATAVAESLARVGVESSSAEVNDASAAVAVFDDYTEAVRVQLRDISNRGRRRVLGITGSRPALASGGALRLLRDGCADVLFWDGVEQTVERARALLERWQAVEEILASAVVTSNLIGTSNAWVKTLREIIEVAHFTNASILILGESGTGKELIARLVQALDARPAKGPLVVLDCATIVPELSGSEFFGHERGAFTGAGDPRDGAFALAHGGTLFLDEVGELEGTLQAQLLRVVQEGTYKRVGGNRWHKADFRLVCATNRDLPDEVTAGRFRRDFYHRIASWVCRLPPLCDRPEDILPLARHFVSKVRADEAPLELDQSVREYLLNRAYPGNVRDLRQVVSRMAQRHVGGGQISIGDIPEDERPVDDDVDWKKGPFELSIRRALSLGIGLKEIRRSAEDAAVRIAVAEARGNLQNAAGTLHVTDRALQLRRANQRG